MIFRFNTAQLGAKLERSLNLILAEMQKTRTEEIEVIADEFPYNLIVKADGKEAKISWDESSGLYQFVAEPLPASQPESPNIGEIKEWQRPEKTSPPPPEPRIEEIKVTVDSVVSQFMGLTPDQRTKFFCEAWRSIAEETK